MPQTFEFALPLEPYPYDPAKARQLLAEAGYPNGFDAGELHQLPPYFALGEAIAGYMQAVGIRLKMRITERGAYMALISSKKAKGLCVCSTALYGNAAGGVISVFTADGADSPGLRLSLGAGSFGAQRETLDWRGADGALDYVLDYTHFRTDGYREHSRAARRDIG